MPEIGPMPTPEMGPQIVAPTSEVLSVAPESPISVDIPNIDKSGRVPERPPQVEKKYRVEEVGRKEENTEEEMHKAREKINEEFDNEKPETEEILSESGNRNYYEILGVSQDASQEEIKRVYFELAKEMHPDMGGDADEFKEIKEAFETLFNKDRKKQYDFGLNEQMPVRPAREYQQESFYEQGTGTIHDLWGDPEERRRREEYDQTREQTIEIIREKIRNSVVEERWSLFTEQEREIYNNDIEELGKELEEKRGELETKLHLGKVSEDFFYDMCRNGYKPENCRRYGLFVEKIEMPRSDGSKPFKMPPERFHTWMRKIENYLKVSIEKQADVMEEIINNTN